MTWDEHLSQCKARALVYVDKGQLDEAVLSIAVDIQKHPDARVNQALVNQALLEALVQVATFDWHREGIRQWIEGFR